jgi:hypothetical protein
MIGIWISFFDWFESKEWKSEADLTIGPWSYCLSASENAQPAYAEASAWQALTCLAVAKSEGGTPNIQLESLREQASKAEISEMTS